MVRLQTLSALFLASWLVGSTSAQQVELLDFYLPTCGPCHAMAPVVDRLAAEGVAVRKVDGSREVGLAQRFQVQGYPTFVATVDGREVGRIVGPSSYGNLRGLIDRAQPTRSIRPTSSSSTFAPTSPSSEQASTPLTSAMAALVDASVRIVIDDPQGRAYGTGTLIDAREGEALVVTCAHLFRDGSGGLIPTEGKLLVERFDTSGGTPRVVEQVAGHLVSYDFEADVALVSLRPAGPVVVAPVAPLAASTQVGSRVRSVGCDLGADPSIRDSRVVAINRYQGSPNIETTGAPVQGRSGGGLFNAEGELVGLCFAADEQADEGLYAGLASIHQELDRVGLTELYEQGARSQALASLPAAASARVPPRSMPHESAPSEPASQLAPVALPPAAPATTVAVSDPPAVAPSDWPAPIVRGQRQPEVPLNQVEQATLEEVVRRGTESEVVLLIRPKTGDSGTEVLTLDSASPEFVAALRRMGTVGAGQPAPPAQSYR